MVLISVNMFSFGFDSCKKKLKSVPAKKFVLKIVSDAIFLIICPIFAYVIGVDRVIMYMWHSHGNYYILNI